MPVRIDRVTYSALAGVFRSALATLVFLFASCATGYVVYYSAPTLLPGVIPAMRTAGFWIGRLDEPDDLVMTPEEIGEKNDRIVADRSLATIVGAMPPTIDGKTLRSEISARLSTFRKSTLFMKDGKSADATFYDAIERNIDTAAIPELVPVRFAFAVSYGDVRSLPSRELLNDIPRELFLDHLQVSALDIGTPLAVLHESADNNWYYVRAPLFSGWVDESVIAFTGRSDIVYFSTCEPYVIVTSPKADLWADETLTSFIGFARAGTRFPLSACTGNGASLCVEVPVRGAGNEAMLTSAYVSVGQVHEGYLRFSKRSALSQAFRFLDAPYGWGDMYGEQDCSRFVCEVFGVMGLLLPRNSSAQAVAAGEVIEFPESMSEAGRLELVLARAIPGITLLRYPGHIMIYIGEYEGVPYVIHSFWAYEEKDFMSDRLLMVNKTSVSSLLIGSGTKKGSYLSRLTHMTIVGG